MVQLILKKAVGVAIIFSVDTGIAAPHPLSSNNKNLIFCKKRIAHEHSYTILDKLSYAFYPLIT